MVNDNHRPRQMRGVLPLWLILFVVWSAANGSLDIGVMIVGLILTLVIAVFTIRICPIWRDSRLTPAAAVGLLLYTAVFLREVIRSNLEMLRYVYSRKLELTPGILPIRTHLTSRMGRLVLANTITLTPGTMVMEIEGDTLFVHVLDVSTTDIDENTAAVAGSFEPVLERTFG